MGGPLHKPGGNGGADSCPACSHRPPGTATWPVLQSSQLLVLWGLIKVSLPTAVVKALSLVISLISSPLSIPGGGD